MNSRPTGRRDRRRSFSKSTQPARRNPLSPHWRRLRLEHLEDRLALSQILHVDADALPGGSGDTWGEALVSLQAALDRAELLNADADPGNDITDIWIAEGMYVPSKDKHGNDSPEDPRTLTFSLLSGVSLYGGFAGTEESLDQRVGNADGSWAHETILSGDLAGNDVPEHVPSLQENSYTVVYGFDLPASLTLDALTITAGVADGPGDDSNPEWQAGGGVYTSSNAIAISNSTLRRNSAWKPRGMAADGGGIYNSGTLTLTDSTVSDSRWGGGIHNSGMLAVSSSTVSGNRSGVYAGGGIYNSGTLTVTDSTLNGNWTNDVAAYSAGGGVYNTGTLTITHSVVTGNRAARAGGVYNDGALTLNNSMLSLIDHARRAWVWPAPQSGAVT